MDILSTFSLNSNKNLKFNFSGGDLSSDSGLLLIREFASKIGFDRVVRDNFHTNDTACFRLHTDSDNLMQIIYQDIADYDSDDCADEVRHDPVLTQVLDKSALASQPTLSRFWNRADTYSLKCLNNINRIMRKIIYSVTKPQQLLLDLDSTLLSTYGNQEGHAFNYHYQANGYHPLMCFDGLTGDCLKVQLREGSKYCSNAAYLFTEELLDEIKTDFPDIELFFRGDSGFAEPNLLETLETNGCKYVIRLKENNVLMNMTREKDDALARATRDNMLNYAVEYGEFEYQAKTWSHPRKVVFKIEKPEGTMLHLYTFIVTNMDTDAIGVENLIRIYCARGRMENFIKECKSGFGCDRVCSSSMIVNANRLMVHVLSYNLFNWFRRIVLPKSLSKLNVDTLRIKILKVASRVVSQARYKIFKLCSGFAYKEEFLETLNNISRLRPILE